MFFERAGDRSREGDTFVVSYHVDNEFEGDVELVFVVLTAGTPLVPRVSIENTEHREIREVIVHPSTNERIYVGVFGDPSIQREDVEDSRGGLIS